MEERTLDSLWEKIEKENPVLWAQMEKFYGPMSIQNTWKTTEHIVI
jgi:hypothetical protein